MSPKLPSNPAQGVVTSNTKLPDPAPKRTVEEETHGRYMTRERMTEAQEALRQARKFLPGLNSIATRMAGRKIEVVFDPKAPAPSTDGKVIRLIPSLDFAKRVPHVNHLCGKRDEATDKLLCAACSRVDSMFATFQHEVAHLVHGSFDNMTDADKIATLDRIIAERGADKPGVQRVRTALERGGDQGFMVAASMVSPYLPMLLNAMEDARVNREAMQGLPGLKRSFRADVLDVMANGVEDPETGERLPWSDRDLDSQATIAAFLVAIGEADCVKYLADEVQDLYNDNDLLDLVSQINLATSVGQAFDVAYTTLEALKSRGFLNYKHRDDEEEEEPESGPGVPSDEGRPGISDQADSNDDKPEQDAESKPEQNDASSNDDKSGGGNGPKHEQRPETDEADEASGSADESDDSEDSDDDKSGGGDSDQDDAGTKDDESSDEPDDGSSGSDGEEADDNDDTQEERIEQLKRDLLRIMGHAEVIVPDEDKLDMSFVDAQLQMMDQPSLEVGRIVIHQWPPSTSRARVTWSQNMWTPRFEDMTDQAAVGRTIVAARMAFAENRAIHTTKGLRAGRVNTPALARLKTGDDKLFRRRQKPDSRDYFAVVGLDISGSTGVFILNLIRKVGWGMGEVFNRTGVKFSMYCHSGEKERNYDFTNGTTCDLYEIKAANEPWNERTQQRLRYINSTGFNLDGHSLEQYRRMAERSNATDRIIFYLTDGAMPNANRAEETELLLREIEICRKSNIKLIGIGVENDDPVKFGLDTIRIDRMDELPRLIKQVGERL